MYHNEFYKGYTACYIQDYAQFRHFCEIPVSAAVEWVKRDCPNVLFYMDTLGKDLTVNENPNTDADKNGWMNKMFVLVGSSHGKWIALVKWDFKFQVYVEG
jgi:hypothetical protein